MRPLINFVLEDVIVFIFDKHNAKIGKRRVRELYLILLEILGGIFLIMPLIHGIKHKSNKMLFNLLSIAVFFFLIFSFFFFI